MNDKKTDELIELMQLHHVILRQMQAEYLSKKNIRELSKELELVEWKRREILESGS